MTIDEKIIEPSSDIETGFVPINPQIPADVTAPSFSETLGANLRQYNVPYRLGKKLLDTKYTTLGLVEREEDFDPIKEGLLANIPNEYYTRVLTQKTRQDAMMVLDNIKQEVSDQEIAHRSGIVANMVTTFGAVILDPTTLIPLSQTVKHANAAKGFAYNFGRSALELGAINAAQNAFLVASKETQGLSDWFVDTMTDTFMGASIGGLLGTYASRSAKTNVNNPKAYFKAAQEDLDIVVKLDAKGNPEGLDVAIDKVSGMGAAETPGIQAMLDSGKVSFRDNKFIKHVFGLGSPIIKGVTSSYDTVRKLTTELWGTNFRTAGGVALAIQDPGAEDFVRSWMALSSGVKADVRALYLKHIGVEGFGANITAPIGAMAGKHITEREFNELVGKAYRRNFSEISEVNQAQKLMHDVHSKLWEEAKKRFPELQDEEFTNIVNHLMRIYDKEKIKIAPDDFAKDAYTYMSKVNQKIASYTQREDIARNKLKSLQEQNKSLQGIKGKDARNKRNALKKQIANAKQGIKQLEKQRLDDIRSGVITRDMLEEKVRVSPEEALQLKKLREPQEKILQELEALKTDLKTKKTVEERKFTREKIKESREKLKAEREKITQKIINDTIPENLTYVTRFGKIALKNPDKLPPLRKVKSVDELWESARSTRDTIQQLNEEQLVGALFGQVRGNTPSTLKGRSFLWNDAVAEPWLINDISAISDIYMSGLSRYLHGYDVFKKYGIDVDLGKAKIANALKGEFERFRETILKEPQSPARDKKLQKLHDDFDSNKKLLENFHDAYFGSLVDMSSTAYRASNAAKQFTSAVLLTNMPILMLTEFVTPTFRMAFDTFTKDGLFATLGKMNSFNTEMRKKLGTEASRYLKGYYADAGIGMNRLHGQSLEAKFGYGKQYYQKTWYEKFTGATGKLVEMTSFANQIMDAQEVFTASMAEGRLMRILKKYVDGEKLIKEEINFLDESRVHPDKWAHRFMKQFNREIDGKTIGQEIEGSFVANYHLWDDFEAAQMFRIALDRNVRMSVVKPGRADVPFAFKDPIGSLLFQFLSWPFAATTNFLVPALTEFEMQKFIGIVMMLNAGAMIDPLRQLAKGEKVDMSAEALIASAFANSGIMGWQYDMLTRALSYLNFRALRPGDEDTPINSALRILQPDRHRGKGISSLLGSPTLGTIDMAGNVFSSLLSGEFNQTDANRAIRLMAPYAYTYYTQSLFKKALEATSLPATRREAQNE